MTYEERLRVPLWWWLVGAGLVLSVLLAVYAFLDAWLTVTLVALAAAIVVVGLLSWTLRIRVDEQGLQVGRHLLETAYIGDAETAEGDISAATDADSFILTRPFVPRKVRVRIDDDADPHPAWLISTRNPTRLVEAIRAIKEQ